MFLHIVGPLFSGDCLDDHSRDRESKIRIFPAHLRRIRRRMLQHVFTNAIAGGKIELGPMRTSLPRKSSAMRQQFFNGDRRIVGLGRLQLEPVQIFHYRIIQPQFPGVAQLHDRCSREQFAVRRHAKPCRGRHRSLQVDIRKTESLRPNQLLVRYHTHCNARQPAISNLRAYPAFEQPLLAGYIGIVRNPGV